MAKKNPPCIRGLDVFKKGCPQMEWDGERGCPCWKELIVTKKGSPLEKEAKKQCIDLWSFEFQWAQMGQNEAQINLSEQLRNGLLMQDVNGQDVPKPDMLIASVLREVFSHNKKQLEQDAQKISEQGLIDIK